jgi:hypothetical protein
MMRSGWLIRSTARAATLLRDTMVPLNDSSRVVVSKAISSASVSQAGRRTA